MPPDSQKGAAPYTQYNEPPTPAVSPVPTTELSQLCRDAGLTELFFTSLNIHNSMSDGGDDSQASKAKDRARKKGGKKR